MKNKSFIAALLLLNVFGSLCVYAIDEGDVEWTGDWGYAAIECSECGAVYTVGPVESLDEAWAELQDYFCEDCGSCDDNANIDCWLEHHCLICGDCIDDEYCHLCYEATSVKVCYDCSSDFGPENDHCYFCHRHFGEFDDLCDCGYSTFFPHCEGCSELRCEVSGDCLIVAGEETSFAESPACLEHAICWICMREGEGDDEHCRLCYACDYDICPECHLCDDCSRDENHCPECDFCFGDNEIEMCQSGGEHCIHCCEENDWLCSECGRCSDGAGVEMCDWCGLCEECCQDNSRSEDCSHDYCIMSAEYEDHLCPDCMKCPDDQECEYCHLCEDCQEGYHCEHNVCPDSDEWEEHFCVDCGNCFELDKLCEICHKCEDCNEHCAHGVCPEDPNAGDDASHFTCIQCLECFEGTELCEFCELCQTCCEANTVVKGCNHGLCVKSDAFMQHWCYADGQCLESCDHDKNCSHAPEDFYCSDATVHWQVCIYCGMSMNKAMHTEGSPVIVVEPNPETGRNGTAHLSCAVCAYNMGTLSIPCVPIPTDGSPYILIQPKDYTGKTNMNAKKDVPDLYTTFKVKAGGPDLHYQWYRSYGNNFSPVPTDYYGWYEGAQTPTLTVLVHTDACESVERFYCVVSNANGTVVSNTVAVKAHHVFGRYENNGNGTHDNCCYGECDVVKSTSPHRWGEWKLVRAATDTQTGLREQKCLDCYAKNSVVISKVEPGHEHNFDDLYYNETQHWYFCACGLMTEPADHVFAAPVVTKQPTEKQYGEQVRYCHICDAGIKERLDKLPHVHDWYEANYANYTTSGRGGYSSQQHFVCCKKCDQKNAQQHNFQSWVIINKATSSKSGRIARECWDCPYVEYKYYNYGTYPIMVEGGVANYNAAAPGTPVVVTYTLMKDNKWEIGQTHWKDMSSEGIGLVPVTLSDGGLNPTLIFVMPNGPVGLEVYGQAPCHHTGQTKMGAEVAPTCTGYGHEPDKLCADCGAVVNSGARIEALGHVLSVRNPNPGTVKIEYCYISVYNRNTERYESRLNPATHGYSGDFNCSRCGQTVRGKNLPLRHGYKDTRGQISVSTTMRNNKDATCSGYGYSGDTYCNYCNRRSSKGHRTEPLGHEWGEWELIREASPTVRGLEQRVCQRDESHTETRLTDYSGPHYKIKANKSKISFSVNYGEQPEPETINFVSKGRNGVKAIKQVSGPSGSRRRANGSDSFFNVTVDGMTMTIMPDMEALMSDMTMSEKEMVLINSVITDEGEEVTDFNAPQIIISVKINKADPNLHMERSVRNTRPGVSVSAPVVTSDVAGTPIEWKSSDYSVAAVDAVTGKVTPMRAYGSATITASYPGDQYYKSDKVSYTLNIISKQVHYGCIWQDATDAFSGAQVKTDAEAQQVRILPTKGSPGKVDIAFSGFTIPITGTETPIFTVSGVNVTDYEDGTVIYDLSGSEAVWLTFGEGVNAHTYRTTLEGSQLNGFDIPVLKLTLDGNVTDIVWFGPEGMNLEDVIGTGIKAHTQSGDTEGVYDLSGRKLQKVQQPGVYIKEGRKVSVK